MKDKSGLFVVLLVFVVFGLYHVAVFHSYAVQEEQQDAIAEECINRGEIPVKSYFNNIIGELPYYTFCVKTCTEKDIRAARLQWYDRDEIQKQDLENCYEGEARKKWAGVD